MDKPLASYRRLFPVTEQYTYLNHAACAAIPTPGVEALARYWDNMSRGGTNSEPPEWDTVEIARGKMARLIGAETDEIGWIQNTAMGVSLVATGLDWHEGENIVTVQGEFPANVYPWLGLKQRGVETKLVHQRDNRVVIEDIADAIDSRTRVLSISYVDFATGFRNNLPALGQLCQEHGIIFNVDGIQGLGALDIDVHACGIHFMSAGVHKWLMGPQGLGVFYARRDMLAKIEPWTANWYSTANPSDHFTYGQPWREGAIRVEGSTRNTAAIVAFDAVLDLLHEAGIPRIEAHILGLTDRLIEGLLTRGYRLVSSQLPGERSGVVSFHAKGDPADLLARANAEKITIAVRVGLVRVSPHFYNTEEEIDKLLAIL